MKDLKDIKPKKSDQPGVSTPSIEKGSEFEDHLSIAGAQGRWPNWNSIDTFKGETSFSRVLDCLLSMHPEPNVCWVQVLKDAFPRCFFSGNCHFGSEFGGSMSL